ncbi:MAG TPA: hypothetical protein VMU65_16205 [Candidatus Saccharimonadales bacterium]|nr:hypothetical protein [Candidatus Saccharimonadales bacterium]
MDAAGIESDGVPLLQLGRATHAAAREGGGGRALMTPFRWTLGANV